MLSGKDYPIAEKVTNFQRQRARADRSRRKTDTYAQDSVRIQDAELPDYHDSGLDDDGALQGNVDIYPGFTGSPLPTPQSFESGIAKEINGSPHLQIALEKPISESNLSGRRNLSDLGLRSASLFDQPSSPSAAGDIKGDSRPNVRKRSSHQVSHPDEETAPPSKSHNRALSGSDTAFDKAPHLSNQSSVLYDSARDAVTSGASPTRHLSGRAQPTKSVRTGFSPTTGVGTHSTVMALPGTSLGTKVGAGSHKFFHSTSSQPFKAIPERTSPMLLQPETRPITQDQLVNEVKGIYAGLIMVEKKAVEIDQQQAATTNKLSNEQWQALIALHRTLLHEHHDFFLASQHPSASPGLRKLATKYAMPSRMWRHGIHSFLELLRHRLPDSLDHMLAFVYLAYSMMGLLKESITSFEETWIECLGDLARYRMAIEEADLRDRETWSNVARMWYNKAADKSPDVGRIQHHLAVLSRPNIVQQLFYYSKALVSVVPFQNARESVMLLWNPFLDETDIASQRYPVVEATFVKSNGIHFTRGSVAEYRSLIGQFVSIVDNHIGRVTAKWRVQGPEIASTLCAAVQDFGNSEAFLSQILRTEDEKREQAQNATKEEVSEEQTQKSPPVVHFLSPKKAWSECDEVNFRRLQPTSFEDAVSQEAKFSGSEDTVSHAFTLTITTFTINLQRIGDKNVLPFVHIILAFIWCLSYVPAALGYLEAHLPWGQIVTFLNTIGRSGVVDANYECDTFPPSLSGTGRQLPEDFVMRGLLWAQKYFPSGFFEDALENEDERTLEMPSHGISRAERCLWLGRQLAMLDRWLSYDTRTKQFSVTEFAKSLPSSLSFAMADGRSPTMSATTDNDVQMLDI